MDTAQLESRIQSLIEGSLPTEHWPGLHRELLDSENAREIFCLYTQLHVLLIQHFSEKPV